MSAGSEFQTEGAVTLKPREAKVVRTWRPTTDWCWRRVETMQEYDNKEGSRGKLTVRS